jgi:nucleotide-binding universal stress UspA family protein
MSTITSARAEAALEQGIRIAAAAGIDATSEIVRNAVVGDALLEQVANYDLLVVGSHGHSWAGGIMLGSSATFVVHRSPASVLVARRALNQLPQFPKKILVASDGSPESTLAVEAVAGIACNHHSQVFCLHIEGLEAGHRALAEQSVRLTELTGREPTVIEEHDHVHETIVRVAEQEHASLIVVGSRGLGGVRALGSVSERVAHKAHCSVLIVR